MSSLLYLLFIDCTLLYILNLNLIVLSLLTDSIMEGYSPRSSYTCLHLIQVLLVIIEVILILVVVIGTIIHVRS